MSERQEIRSLASEIVKLISVYKEINDHQLQESLRLEIIEKKIELEDRLDETRDEDRVAISISAAGGTIAVTALVAILSKGVSIPLVATASVGTTVGIGTFGSRLFIWREQRRIQRQMRRIEAVLEEIGALDQRRR